MSVPVAELVERVASITDHALLSAASRKAIGELETILPACTGGVSLECHLGPGRSRTDFVVRVMRRDRRNLLRCRGARLAPARRFALAWTKPGSRLARIPYVDLEFDLDGSGRECFVGAMIEPNLHRGMAAVPHEDQRWFDTAPSFSVACSVLAAAERSPIAEPLLRQIHRAFEALPHGGVIGHLGSLRCRQSRGEDLVRLIVSLPRRALASYLDAVRWPGNLAALQAALRRDLGVRADRIDLDLNVTARGLSPDTGFYRAIWNPRGAGVVRLARRLRAAGLATGAQENALTRFAAGAPAAVHGIPWTITFKTKLDARGVAAAKAYLSLLATG